MDDMCVLTCPTLKASNTIDLIQLIFTRPRTHQELFNLRHAELRNVIEQIFGVSKKRFKVLTAPQEYDLKTQAQIMCVLAVLHNFIRTHNPEDIEPDEADIVFDPDEECNNTRHSSPREERSRAVECRETITRSMWAAYVAGNRNRR
jgi:hypothetical protein